MAQPAADRAFRIVIVALSLVTVGVLAFIAVVVFMTRPPSADAVAATLAALPSPTPLPTHTPTLVPTLAPVTAELLVCQRDAGQAMTDRRMAAAVNISGDHLFLVKWFSLDWQVQDLDDALPGLVMAFDVAVDVWKKGCAVYDRVQVEVYDRQGEQQAQRLNVSVRMDDLLRWRSGELKDADLLTRLTAIQATTAP